MRWLLDLLYPPKCPFCRRLMDRGENILCHSCQRALPWTEGARGIRQSEFLDGCAAPLWYRDQVRASHHRYKFSGLRGYAKPYSLLMAQCVQDRLEEEFDVVCWVPLNARRRRKRGYDQSGLLAEGVAKHLGIACRPLLVKTRNVPPQSGQPDAAVRRANVLGAYAMESRARVEGQRVLLVDDVMTTGATLSECARVLRTAGAQRVCGLVLAHTPPRKE